VHRNLQIGVFAETLEQKMNVIGHHAVRNHNKLLRGKPLDNLRYQPRCGVVVFEHATPPMAANRQEIAVKPDVGKPRNARWAIGHATVQFN
jgi:hypothetical protein